MFDVCQMTMFLLPTSASTILDHNSCPATKQKMNAHRRPTALLAVGIVFNILTFTSSLSVPPTKGACKIKICHNKDCTKKGGGESLLNTFRDLIPASTSEDGNGVIIESSGCLSQCGNGPNVMIVHNDKEERVFFGVEDATTASAVLEVGTGEEYPINLLVAATSILEAEHCTSSSGKEKHLTEAISAVTKDEDQSLLTSFAHAHALSLRADARLDMSPPNIEGAIADAKHATQLAPSERKVWRVLASAYEAAGSINDAINAVRELLKVDPHFSTKAKNEIDRLASLM